MLRLVAIGQLRYAPRTKRPADSYNRRRALQKGWRLNKRIFKRRGISKERLLKFAMVGTTEIHEEEGLEAKSLNFEFVNSWN